MNRLGVCAAVVAMVSALSVPARALIFGATPTENAARTSVEEPLGAARTLSPEGKPVRIISLTQANPPADRVATSWQPVPSESSGSEIATLPSAKPEPVPATSSKPAILAVDHAHPVRKPAAAAHRNTRSALPSTKRFLLASGLY
jgi:hypothetical protein